MRTAIAKRWHDVSSRFRAVMSRAASSTQRFRSDVGGAVQQQEITIGDRIRHAAGLAEETSAPGLHRAMRAGDTAVGRPQSDAGAARTEAEAHRGDGSGARARPHRAADASDGVRAQRAVEPADHHAQAERGEVEQVASRSDGPVRPAIKTLDELWEQADGIGQPALEKDQGKGTCTASIRFSTPNGSFICARGRGTTPRTALHAAIDEALALKAGYEFASAPCGACRPAPSEI